MSCKKSKKSFITLIFDEPNYDEQELGEFIDDVLKGVMFVYITGNAFATESGEMEESLTIISRNELSKADLRDIFTNSDDENIRVYVDGTVKDMHKSKKFVVTKLIEDTTYLGD